MTQQANPPQDQPTYWNEDGGRRWVDNIDRVERMLQPLAEHLLRHAAPRAGERVLDVGCGGGVTSAAFAQAVGQNGKALGLDVSAVILEVARRRYEAVGNLSFALGDAQTLALEAGAYDLITSRFGVMFFADPVAAFVNLRRALAADGRLAFICWRPLDENPWMGEPVRAAFSVLPRPDPQPAHAPGPFALADATHLRGILDKAGYTSVSLEPLDQPLQLGSIDDAVEQMTRMGPAAAAYSAADAKSQGAVRAAVRAALEPFASGGSVQMASATWLVRARPG